MKGVRAIVRGLALVVLVVATGVALERLVLHPLRCARKTSVGAAAFELDTQRGDYRVQQRARQVRADLNECRCVFPLDVRIPFTLGAAAQAAGDSRAAVADYQEALRIDRRPEIYLWLGLAQLDTLDRGQALDNLTRACAFDPARLREIPYDDVRHETKQRLIAQYTARWLW
jgi:tetratricopeptide (TPR) repeat protein